MKLRDWREVNDLTLADFAKLINVETRMTISRYERGLRFPEPAVMQRIIRVTEGAVQANDFYDLLNQKPARNKARTEGTAA